MHCTAFQYTTLHHITMQCNALHYKTAHYCKVHCTHITAGSITSLYQRLQLVGNRGRSDLLLLLLLPIREQTTAAVSSLPVSIPLSIPVRRLGLIKVNWGKGLLV